MTITQQLSSLGSWSIDLVPDTPRSVTDQLGFFGHIAVWRGRVDVEQATDADLLTSARYVGVLREKPTGRTSLEGAGMIYWLGDEDGKGAVLESPVVFSGATLTHCVTTLLPPAITVGTIHDPGGTYTGTHQWQTPRAVLDTVTAYFGVEYRVNGNGTIDVGTQAQLYGTTATTIISARGAGQDFDLTSLGATFTTDTAVVDYSSRVVVLGQKTDSAGTSTSFVEGTADAATFPYKDLHGNRVHVTRTVSDSGQTDASAPAAAQVQLNLYNRAKRALDIRADDYDTTGQAVVGQNAYVFDPENGLYDPATQIDFRGELIFPTLIRISALQWSVTEGHTVAFRTQDGVWVDLTRYVSWDPGSDQITVGDLPRTLTTGSNPVLDQTQAAPDSSTPNPPTGLALTTTSVESSVGQSTATISASWTAPTENTDGSVITDLSYYLVRWQWVDRATVWESTSTAATSIDLAGLTVGLVYNVQVAAVDTTGHQSAWTPVESITAAPDQTAPNPPSDPVVTSYLGQLRIAWDGKDNTGAAMPPDFAIVEVHVSATSGFTPDSSPGSATLVSELSTAGVAYATAPYGSPRYVKLVAVDNSFNRSAPSGQASGSTVQVADGDVASLSVGKLTAGTMTADVVVSGQLATALTGGRTVMNALGFQKFASDGVTKMIDFTGAQNLLTGTLQTALTGRRIVTGAAGSLGEMDFYAPDGTKTYVRGFTDTNGVECIQMGMPDPTGSFFWNKVHVNSDQWMNLQANKVDVSFDESVGFFIIRATADKGVTTSFARFQIDNRNLISNDTLGRTMHLITSESAIYMHRFFTYSNDTAGTTYDGFLQIDSSLRQEVSSYLKFFTREQPNGFVYGGLLRFWVDAGTYANPRIEVWDQSTSTLIPVWASAFTVGSDSKRKANITDLDVDALAVVKTMRGRKWDEVPALGRDEHGHNGGPTKPRKRIGLVAQEAPAEIVVNGGDETGLGIDLYAQTTLNTVAIGQVAAAVDALTARLDALDKKGKP